MPFFKKKPVVIEARQLTDIKTANEIARWCNAQPYADGTHAIVVPTLEGDHRAEIGGPGGGDWIIKGVKGEFYPCKPDIFEATYEPVGRSEPE